jgi:CheY-like chemotaxis protein
LAQRLSILVVDDQPAMARTIQRQLRAHDVRAADTLRIALASIAIAPPDVVLCDFNLGSESGTDLLADLRTRYPTIRRVLYSGRSMTNVDHLIEAGVIQAFVRKPWSLDELTGALGISSRSD